MNYRLASTTSVELVICFAPIGLLAPRCGFIAPVSSKPGSTNSHNTLPSISDPHFNNFSHLIHLSTATCQGPHFVRSTFAELSLDLLMTMYVTVSQALWIPMSSKPSAA